jgi:hypothetical protein
MKASFSSIALAFVAFSGTAPAITPAAANTPSVVAHARGNVTKSKPLTGARRTIRTPSHEVAQCAPDDRKCEVELKLKGSTYDTGF